MPADWRAVQTPDGKTYYHNRKTNETSWKLPTVGGGGHKRGPSWHAVRTPEGKEYYVSSEGVTQWAKPTAGLLPPGWMSKKTAEGKVYFFNRALNKTQWHPPTV